MTTEIPAATDTPGAMPEPAGASPGRTSGGSAAELEQLRANVAKTAHDLSNALGAVLNYSTFLSEDLSTSEVAREYLPHLENAARRALQLVDRLAD
jgi:signal transduction histidine kinase